LLLSKEIKNKIKNIQVNWAFLPKKKVNWASRTNPHFLEFYSSSFVFAHCHPKLPKIISA
jgi:hypothetical protein